MEGWEGKLIANGGWKDGWEDGRKGGRTEEQTEGRTSGNSPYVLQDIGPLGPLPKKDEMVEFELRKPSYENSKNINRDASLGRVKR